MGTQCGGIWMSQGWLRTMTGQLFETIIKIYEKHKVRKERNFKYKQQNDLN